MLRYTSYNKRMFSYGNNLLRIRQSQTSYLLHLDAPHRQPFPPSLVTLTPSPNNTSTPPPKIAKPKRNNSQLSLTAITRQFSSPAEPTGFKLIHVPVRCRLPLQQLRSNLRRLHVNTRRILYIHYSDRNLPASLSTLVMKYHYRLVYSFPLYMQRRPTRKFKLSRFLQAQKTCYFFKRDFFSNSIQYKNRKHCGSPKMLLLMEILTSSFFLRFH
jgi:hypothetical protein